MRYEFRDGRVIEYSYNGEIRLDDKWITVKGRHILLNEADLVRRVYQNTDKWMKAPMASLLTLQKSNGLL